MPSSDSDTLLAILALGVAGLAAWWRACAVGIRLRSLCLPRVALVLVCTSATSPAPFLSSVELWTVRGESDSGINNIDTTTMVFSRDLTLSHVSAADSSGLGVSILIVIRLGEDGAGGGHHVGDGGQLPVLKTRSLRN